MKQENYRNLLNEALDKVFQAPSRRSRLAYLDLAVHYHGCLLKCKKGDLRRSSIFR